MSAVSSVQVGVRSIGASNDNCFIIAEVGVNHNGEPALAHRLIDVAAASGADAVKFQTFATTSLVAAAGSAAREARSTSSDDQYRMLKDLELPIEVWPELAAHADDKGLVFLSSAFDEFSLDLVVSLGVPALKVPSGEIDNLPFLRRCAQQGLPILLSTGMATEEEVAMAIDALAETPGVCLLHCVTAYPAPLEYSNLRAIATLRERFRVPTGWSDHTGGTTSAVAAIALGAAVLEKHVTLDRSLVGPDHAASASPEDLMEYIQTARSLEVALGDGEKRPTVVEVPNIRSARRGLYAARDIAVGEAIGDSDVVALRPVAGLSAAVSLRGSVARVRIPSGAAVQASDVQWPEGPEA